MHLPKILILHRGSTQVTLYQIWCKYLDTRDFHSENRGMSLLTLVCEPASLLDDNSMMTAFVDFPYCRCELSECCRMRELANKILTRTDLGYLTKSVTNGFKHIWNHHLVDLNMPVGCPTYQGDSAGQEHRPRYRAGKLSSSVTTDQCFFYPGASLGPCTRVQFLH